MDLGARLVDLIGLHLLDDLDQIGAVDEVAAGQHQAWISLMRLDRGDRSGWC